MGALRCAVDGDIAAGLKESAGLSMARGYRVLAEGTCKFLVIYMGALVGSAR